MSQLNDFNQTLIAEFRANSGQILTGPFAGRSLLLLTTHGARSGQPRTSPLAYMTDSDRLVVIASKAGAPTNPDWYHNLRAHPEVTVEVRSERYQARAVVAEGAERERLFAQAVAQMPGFAAYQEKTTRQLPVVVLARLP
ncbi:MAG: nitroreductase family deazaflavin-dependent oxidoreductase [Oscillochloris sp.]|nr:nitroreductase family deazaflavin-dependent oxidoreductase [Oscillochloris sp.]